MGTPISGYGPPTTKTRAQVGDFYIDQDSQKVYKCTAINPGSVLDYGFIDIHQGHDEEYEWFELFGDTIKPTSAAYLFASNSRLDWLPFVDTSACISFDSAFLNSNSLAGISELDTSSGKVFTSMFNGCSKLASIPSLDTHNGTRFEHMFNYCTSLETVPEIDTSNGTTFERTFKHCTNLTSLPHLNTAKGWNFIGMFSNCKSLTAIAGIDTSNAEYLSNAFEDCTSLRTISGIDAIKCSSFLNAFYGCEQLVNLTVYNIRVSLQIGSGTSWGHLLTVDSLVHTIKELCKVTTQQTLTMGSANLEKIATLYCKVTDDTTEKIDMELCESTDEGAITLSDYALMKNWLIK